MVLVRLRWRAGWYVERTTRVSGSVEIDPQAHHPYLARIGDLVSWNEKISAVELSHPCRRFPPTCFTSVTVMVVRQAVEAVPAEERRT